MDDIQDRLGLFQYMWSLGFISDQTYTLLKLKCASEPFMIPFIYASEACKKVLKIADKEMGNIDHYSVFTPACVASASQSRMLLKRRPVSSDLKFPLKSRMCWGNVIFCFFFCLCVTQITDPVEIEKMIMKVISESPKQLEQYRSGKPKLQGFFAGQVCGRYSQRFAWNSL